MANLMFGLQNSIREDNYLFVSNTGASLLLGWALLLLWGSFKPIERRGVLLISLFQVLFGLIISSILVVTCEFIRIEYMLRLWVFCAVVVPLCGFACVVAGGVKTNA
jgi:hypothetical protein